MSQNIEMSNNDTDITLWEINGNKLHFDANDAEDAERFEDAIDKLSKEEKFARVGKSSEIIRKYCNCFKNFFDTLFGKGTSAKIGLKDNARICNEIYEDFLLFVKRQKENNENFASRLSSYTGNRQQRRSISKSKPKAKK